MKIVYVTGCLGFIGSYVTRKCLQRGWMVYGIDKCTYVANRGLLEEFGQYDNFTFLEKDIKDLDHLYDCDYIINTAAESHVGNSIIDSEDFISSNIMGVRNLLDLVRNKPTVDRLCSTLALMRFMEILLRVNTRKSTYYTPATLIQPQKPPQTCLYWLGQELTM